jgi:hypothetical protein
MPESTKTRVQVVISGPVGCGKSAIAFEIVGALRAVGLAAEVVGITGGDVDSDHIRSLEIYRTGVRVEVSESLFTQRQIEARVGGAYELPDRPGFWIDAPVAREIAARALGTSPSSNDRLNGKTDV